MPEAGDCKGCSFRGSHGLFMAGNVLIGTCYGPVVRMIETGLPTR